MGDHSPIQDELAEGIALYVHIPFCKTKCPYCDFNTYQGIEGLIGPYMEALALEIQAWGVALGHPRVNTVFFGGGTPSYVPAEQIDHVLHTIADAFEVVPGVEITLEANPGDLDGLALARLLEMGVNRLSIGVQSLDDSLLKMLGRRHTGAEALEAYRVARRAGFQSVNLDLMYGLPRQTLGQWKDTLDMVLTLTPPHLSLYCLTLEEGTPLQRWVHEGNVPQPDPDLAADMYTIAQEALERAGYHHYEISNWALPGLEGRHNIAYWLNRPYLGVGPGAHSSLDGHRFWDVASPRLYIQRVHSWVNGGVGSVATLDRDVLQGIGPVDGVEAIGPGLEMAETMMLGLRLLDGLSIRDFQARFSSDPLALYGPEIRDLGELGLLERADGLLRLTKRGCLLANQVFMRFL